MSQAIKRVLTNSSSHLSKFVSRAPLTCNVLTCIPRNTQKFSTSAFVRNASSSKVNQDLQTFLQDEIKAEKENLIALEPLDGFVCEAKAADLLFSKNYGNEKVTIELNVNHTVDSEQPDDGSEDSPAPEMKSKPNFEVSIIKGSETLSMSCSFIFDDVQDMPEGGETTSGIQESNSDIFAIDEVTFFKGEFSEKTYAVAGDILDGYLYDLLMNLLEERGITQVFVSNLSTYCSTYEHQKYIELLENLKSFVSK